MYDTIVRRGAPSEFDQFPRGTACKVVHESNDQFDMWVQLSMDENKPRWELVGTYTNSIPEEIITQELLNKSLYK